MKIYWCQRKLQTEWLNLIRFLSVFYVAWTHFEYTVFAEMHPASVNLEELFFLPPAIGSWFLYGYTGKYAVAILCVVSGFVAALTMKKKSEQSFLNYAIKRYMRIMIPVIGISMLTWMLMITMGENIEIAKVIYGIFVPGATFFYGHFWCLSSFILGNFMIFGLDRLVKKFSVPTRIIVKVVLIGVGLIISYKVYSWTTAWAIAIVFGDLLYELISNFEIKYSRWLYIPLFLLIWWLPRGEESLKLYIRDMIASFLILFILFQINVVTVDINNFCKKRWIKDFLKYSYAFYVVHGFSIKYFACDLTVWIQGWTNNWWITYVISFVLKTIFDMGLAIVVYYLFENVVYRRCCAMLKV